MKLYSRQFVGNLRRHAIARIQQSKKLRREYKARRQRSSLALRPALGLLFLVAIVLFWMFRVSDRSPDFPFVMIAFYVTGTAYHRLSALRSRLHGSELAIFAGLPMPDSEFFRLQWHKFLKGACFLVLAVLSVYSILGLREGHSFASSLAVASLAAVVQGLLVVSVALLLSGLRSPLMTWTALGLYAITAVAGFLPADFSRLLRETTIVLPAGWVNRAYSRLIVGDVGGVLWLLPALGVAVLGLPRLGPLRKHYETAMHVAEDPVAAAARKSANGATLEEAPEDDPADASIPITASMPIVDAEAERSFLWTGYGWVEWIAGACLSQDQRVVADFITGESLGQWTAGWKGALYLSVAAILLMRFTPFVPVWVGIVLAIAAAGLAAPLLGGNWLGLMVVPVSVQRSFVAAFYPLSYWQVSWVMLKINFVRLLGWSLLFVPTFLALGWRFGMSIETSFSFSLKILYCIMIAQFIAVMAQHSKSTNDTKTWSLGMVCFFMFVPFAICGAFVGIFFFLLAPEAPHGLLVGVLILTPLGLITWAAYGLLYNYGSFDLLHESK